MNEKKFITIGFFICFTLVLILGVAYYRLIRRTDTQIDSLTRELTAVSERLEYSTNTIRECSEGLGSISDGLSAEAEGLGTIIENLRKVRNSVQDMENCINNFYSKYGNSDTTDGNSDKGEN